MNPEAPDHPGASVLPPTAASEHFFAWNGVAFLLPVSWELSYCDLRRGVTSVAHEDDCDRRLEAEWLVPDGLPSQDKVQNRFQQQVRAIAEKAGAVLPITGIDDAWTAHEYHLGTVAGRQPPRGAVTRQPQPDEAAAVLVIAYRLPRGPDEPMALFRLHFPPGSREVPAVVMRSLCRSFRWWSAGEAPWQFYDVSFMLRRDFRLAATALQAGRKLLQFEWRLRRLYVWHFSLAELVLAKQSVEAFCVDFLRQSKKLLPVPRWSITSAGGLTYRRRRLHFFGQFEEIGRCCFKYYAWCRHDPARNQIALWVMHYRRAADLQLLPAAIRPDSGHSAP
ncbi:MAG: hypothetical protein ACOX9E_03505 [Lentisphaeria bacterium]|jgi:hypothetical protein